MSKVIADYHMHSISPDARVPMEQMCLAALEHGLTEIAVTDHFEIYTEDYQGKDQLFFTDEYMQNYFTQWEQCNEKFSGKLTIRRGLELGQPMFNPPRAAKLLQDFEYDYIIGSVHKLHNVDMSFKIYRPNTLPGLCRETVDALYRLVDEGDFDCLAHVDLIKRYASRQGQWVNLMDYRDDLAKIFTRLIARGKGIEINTSGIRQKVGEMLPSLDIIRLYHDLGGEILTLGSDAHRVCDVAADLDIARDMALAVGFTKLALYENRQCSFYSIT